MTPEQAVGATATIDSPSAPSAGEPNERARRTTGRRAELDGLRTVAVVLVVAFHAGLTRWRHGFIGVDVFFVLSGFLVTGLLHDQMARGAATDVFSFVARRVRRLLPASLVMLSVVYAASHLVLDPIAVVDATDDLHAAALFHANWHFVSESVGYFADVEQSPFLHMWSLGVEEQFYLAWPLLFLAISLVGARHRDLVVGISLATVVGASLWWSLHLAESSLERSYYGTDARAYQLAAGGLVAWACRRRPASPTGPSRDVIGLAALGGVIVAASSFDGVGAEIRGAAVTALVVALLWALDGVAPRGRALLSAGPLPALGRVSYGTYLWHWPILVALRAQTSLQPAQQFLIALVAGTALGALSFFWLERPRLRSVTSDRTVVVGGLAAAALVAVALPTLLSTDDATGGVLHSGPTELRLEPAAPDLPAPSAAQIARHIEGSLVTRYMGYPNYDCSPGVPEGCIQHEGDGHQVHLVGDSLTGNWHAAMLELAERDGLRISTTLGAGCPWEIGLGFDATAGGKAAETTRPCAGYRSWWYADSIPSLTPDLVLIGASDRSTSGPYAPAEDAPASLRDLDGLELAIASARSTFEVLADTGAHVVVVLPLPHGPDGANCLADTPLVGDCIVSPPGPSDYSRELATVASAAGATVVDMADALCPRRPVCDPIVDDYLVYRDPIHINALYARHISPILRERLVAAGVYPP